MTTQVADNVDHLFTAQAVRARADEILALAEADRLAEWRVDLSRLAATARYVADVVRETYPSLETPFVGCWPRFVAAGRDLWAETDRPGVAPALARTGFDLAICSGLMDGDPGPRWSYRDAASGQVLTRAEGMAVAALRMFQSGALSSEPSDRLRADALYRVDAYLIAEHFQVSDRNPLNGAAERARLLTQLGRAIGQPAALFDIMVRHADRGRLPATLMLQLLMQAVRGVWPARPGAGGLPPGDIWRHPAVDGPVPLHHLTQWIAYSLVEPLRWGGIEVVELEALTGLPDGRNGGLFVDMGVLAMRDPDALRRGFGVESPAVVGWRALTVALLDRLAPLVAEDLGLSPRRYPLARVMQGGTWAAGRRLAAELRADGKPPVTVISDGTVL